MITKMSISEWFRKMVSVLCLLCMIFSGMPYPAMAFVSGSTTMGTEPERARSNYAAQINVPVLANIYVNTLLGGLFSSVPLLHVPAQGMPIDISIRYISGWHAFTTHYGYGWQLNYNMFYVRNENGDIFVVWETGRVDKFIKSNGSFLPPVDTYDTFQEYRPSKYVLKTQQGLEYYFDSPIHKRVSKVQDPNGNYLAFDYNTDMCLISINDNSGRQVQFSYTNGNLSAVVDANVTPNRSIRFTYDANNNMIAIIDAQGNATRYSYDANHYLTTVAPAVGASTSITYSDGAVSRVIGPSVNKTFSYDTANNTTTMTDIAPGGNQVTRYFYDSLDRISVIEDPLGSRTTISWDANNNLVSLTDALNRSTGYMYDTTGKLTAVTDLLGNTTQYTYDSAFSKLKTVTNAKGNTTTYEYDSRGNLILESDPLNNTKRYTYDDRGNLTSRTDANGAITIYDHDEHGYLVKVTYPDNSTVTYSYDSAGNVTGMTNGNASVLFTYDGLNRVTGVNYASHAKSISYTFDAMGNRTSMTDPDGGITKYEYDKANRLVRLTNPLGQATRYNYDANDRLVEKNYHNGTSAVYTYDNANRLLYLVNKKSSGEVISSYAYEYDAAGNRTKMTEDNGGVTTYAYDGLNQLTKVMYPDNSFQEYTYDPVGNRLALTDNNGTTSYTYDNVDRLLSAGTTTYGWDNNGNMIRKTDQSGTTNYDYDYENRLTKIAFPDGTTNSFTYYADWRRLSKTDTSGKIIFFYDGRNVITEADNAGITTARYTSTGTDGWISIDKGGSSYYYHKDGLGSVTGLIDSAGALAAAYHYDAFGDINSQMGSVSNPYTFTGREYDTEGRLYYYRARYYCQSLGRFLSPDPIGLAGGMNLYTYVQNNPINMTDPMGLEGGWASVDWHNRAEERANQWLDNMNIPNGSQTSQESTSSSVNNYFVTPPGSGTTADSRYFGTYNSLGPTAQDSYTGPSSGGGIESKPLKNLKPSYFYQKSDRSNSSKEDASTTQTSFLNTFLNIASTGASTLFNAVKTLFVGSEAYAATLDGQTEAAPLVDLKSVLPTVGPSGTAAMPVTPTGPMVINSNAVEAAAMDFVDSTTSLNKATVFATKTISRAYEHDYPLCNRFHDYTLETAAAVPLPGMLEGNADIPWFWYVSMTKGKLVEEAYLFSVFVDEDAKTFTVDSHWLNDQYSAPDTPAYDYVFNFQIWGASSEEAYKLLRRTLLNLSNFGAGWTVIFANTTEPVAPSVLIKSAVVANTVSLTVQSWLAQPQKVSFTGFVRYPSDRDNSIPFVYEVTVQPGFNRLEMPLNSILDALITVQVNDFTDRIYTGIGSWFPFDDATPGGGSQVTLTLPNCAQAPNLTSSDYILAGCAEITGVVGSHGFVGMARTLNPNDLPIDVSQYQALTFFAKGDGKSYRVKVETESVRQSGGNDFHQFVFTASPEWRQYVIPLSAFVQPGGDAATLVPYTGKDVISLSWSSVGEPLESINLSVDRIAFTNSMVISGTTVLPNTVDTAGPYTVTTQITGNAAVQSASLVYSVDQEHAFATVPMNAGGTIFSASIPGQPLGTEVWYYVQVIDANGNIVTDPIDVLSSTYRFQVSEHPFTQIDDFSDTNNTNALGGVSGSYMSENGGIATVYYDAGSLRLSYDVSTPGSYAGYYSLLNQADLTPYNAVTFMVKGAVGGEKARFGLRDHDLRETNILIGQYLPAGITTSWQKVKIPFAAFTRVSDWTRIENLNLNVENWMGSGVGTIYLDNIRFEYIPSVPVIVDKFNEMIKANGVGGGLWTWTGGGARIDTAYDQTNFFGERGAGYRISYSGVTENEWALAVWDLAGLNASSYGTLSFYLKGANGNEKPNIYLVSRNGDTETRGIVDIENYVIVTTSWQRVNIPLETFANHGVDLFHLSYFEIGFEWATMEGTIYIDDISIGLYPLISLHPGQIDFGPVTVGASSAQPLTITNVGTAALIIDAITIAGANASEFSQSNNCSTLDKNASCSVTVKFLPGSVSAKNAALTIFSNDWDTPTVNIPLAGTGVDTTPPVTTAMITGKNGNSDWYASNVDITFTATDTVSGVKEVHYGIDGGTEVVIAGATASITLSTEGIHAITYYAIDNADNKETPHPLTVKIDKTPSEATVKFEGISKDIKVYDSETGTEASYILLQSRKDKEDGEADEEQHEAQWELRQYTLLDGANNTLSLTLAHKSKGREIKAKLISMQYNGGAVIEAPQNKVEVEYSVDRSGMLKELEQKAMVKKQFEGEAKYRAKKNETEIKVKVPGQKEQKETKTGMVILELLTNKGSVNFRY